MLAARPKSLVALLALLALNGCQTSNRERQTTNASSNASPPQLSEYASPRLKQFLLSALEQTQVTTGYDPSYVVLEYPGGDVPIQTGVCSDVLVRAFREAGVDLQKEVHEDMTLAWPAYPRKWGTSRPDRNIDHRRVLNLMTYFERKGYAIGATANRQDYLPGDVVAWDLGGGVEHIGIVSHVATGPEQHLQIIHNIGAGTKAEDVLFNWKIIGHYRFF